MRASALLLGVLAAAVATSQCGGGDDDGGSNNPVNPGPSGPATVTVSIVAKDGNKSYNPNPVAVSGNEQIVFRNNTAEIHHIVMDDRSIDFGNLAPGGSSAARSVGGGGNFHCDNHPSMVGSINGATAPEPPPGSGDGY